MNIATELDLGPLTWVKSEIDLALARADEALGQAEGAADASARVQFAQTHLHQARGALSIVCLDGLAQFATALDQLLGAMARGECALEPGRLGLARRGLAVIGNYLEELVHGTPDQPLRLFPLYAELAAARGAAAASPVELFFPDLAQRPPRRKTAPPSPAERDAALRQQRTVFERGLLLWLRDPAEGSGARAMAEAVSGIEALESHPQAHALWWAARALFEALMQGDLASSPDVKRPITGLHALIRRLPETPATVPERLLREILYWASQAPARSDHQRAVRGTWSLDALQPEAGATISDTPLAPLLKALQGRLAATKLEWDDFCGGQAAALPRFEERLGELATQAGKLGRPALDRLLQALADFVQWLRKDPLRHDEVVAIEVAAALLLCEAALDRAVPDAAFAGQVGDTVGRLQALARGEALPAAEGSVAVETARRSQEREAQAQLAREILSSLAQVEQTLDDYFRNQQKRGPLATLDRPLKQIEGALALLGETRALTLVHEAAETVARFAQAEDAPEHSEFESLARRLSALGFYVQALQHGGPADLDRFLGIEAAPSAGPAELAFEAPEASAAVAPQIAEPEEAAVAVPRAPQPEEAAALPWRTPESGSSPSAAEAPAEPSAAGAAEPVAMAPAGAGPDADADTEAEPEPQADIRVEPEPTTTDSPPREALEHADLHETVEALHEEHAFEAEPAPPARALPGPAEETRKLAEASADELDAELLAIFIEEAHEVLATIGERLELSRTEPDGGHLTAIRRGFHTLKGSGRMVGLRDLGEAAWGLEQTLNRWLQFEWPPSAALHHLIDSAYHEFCEWVAELEAGGSPLRDVSELLAEAERLRSSDTPIEEPASLARPSAPLQAEAPLAAEEKEAFALEDLEATAQGEAQTTGATFPSIDFALEDIELDDAPQPEEAESDLAADEIELSLESLSETMPADEAAFPAAEGAAPEKATAAADEFSFTSLEPLELPADEFDSPAMQGTADEEAAVAPDEFSLTSLEPLELPVEDEAQPVEAEASPVDFALEDIELEEAPAPEEPEAAPISTEPELPAEILAEAMPAGEATSPASESAAPEAPEASLEESPLEDLESVEAGFDFGDLPQAGTPVGAEAEAAEPQPEEAGLEGLLDVPFEPSDEPAAAFFAAESEILSPDEPVAEPAESIAETDRELVEPLEDDALRTDEEEIEPLEDVIAQAGELAEAGEALPETGDGAQESVREQTEMLEEPLEEEEGLVEALEAEEPAPEPPASASDFVRVGDTEISRPLYDLYCGEARHHLALLHGELARLQANPTRVPPEAAVRAAHTLAGISGTARIMSVHTLARALEHAVERLCHSAQPPAGAQADLLVTANGTLEAMLSEIEARRMPLAVPELEEQLDSVGREPHHEPAIASLQAAAESLAPAGEAVAAPPPVHDDIDEQLLPVFLEEGSELVSQLHATLRNWRADSANDDHANATARLLHTLKGSARMAGAMGLGEHVHQMESRLEAARKRGEDRPALIEEMTSGLDVVEQMMDLIVGGGALGAVPREAQGPSGQASGGTAVAIEAAPGEAEAAGGSATLRVRADTVDGFVNAAGEIGIARSRIEGELRTLRRSLLDLTENVIRLRNQLREVELQADVQMQSRMAQAESRHAEFDPLEMDRYTRLQELTRMMAESVGDVTTVQQNLLRNLDAADLALHSQARLSRDLQQALMQVRMVPFDSLADRLYRIVRQTAKELGKRANLDLRGGRIEIDRSVLEHMTAPLEHLLRNAVAHGIEPVEARRAAGKDEIGQITLDVRQEGNEVVITLADDGSGLDYGRIAERARANGLLGPEEAADERRLTNLIFVPGFSTAGNLSTVSGRGVGMDVVKSETAAVGGRIDVASTPGQGSQFRVYLPLTLAVTQAVLVRAGGRSYAIPSSMIAQVMELRTEAMEKLRAAGGTEWQGEHFAYRYLPPLLGDTETQPELQRFNWVLLLRAGAQTLALHVDALRGNQEIVVKNAGPQLVRIVGISGATVLGDGEIVLILNPVALASRSLAANGPVPAPAPLSAQPAPSHQPTVMVVDDSLTVRKITGRLLEREGYRVITAKDGVDALERLLETLPDVILSDIEMPRMDGFDLLRNIRADERTCAVPVIMITSRLADKHRDYAARIGADHYLGKPYDEAELLALLRGYVASAVPA